MEEQEVRHLKHAIAFIREAQEDCRRHMYVQALLNHEAAIAAIEHHIQSMNPKMLKNPYTS